VSFAALADLLAQVERAAMTFEQGGREIDLHDLRAALIDVLSLIERDPGIEAATEDLYDAAAAFRPDVTASTPLARRLRLLREARLRYCERLTGARPGERAVTRPGES
jgi:hypothetical protein